MTDPYAPQPPQQPVPPVPPVPQQPSLPPQPVYYTQPVAPMYVAPAAALPTNTLAVVSMIFGIASWVVLPIVGAIVAVITGHIAVGQIKRTREGGRGMAIAGVVLGWVQLGFVVVWLAFVAVIVLIGIGTAAGSGGLNS